MFRCEKCETVVEPGTPAQSIIVQERSREYPERSEELQTRPGRRPQHRTIDKGGEGHEIVRELKVCPSCAEEVVGAIS